MITLLLSVWFFHWSVQSFSFPSNFGTSKSSLDTWAIHPKSGWIVFQDFRSLKVFLQETGLKLAWVRLLVQELDTCFIVATVPRFFDTQSRSSLRWLNMNVNWRRIYILHNLWFHFLSIPLVLKSQHVPNWLSITLDKFHPFIEKTGASVMIPRHVMNVG